MFFVPQKPPAGESNRCSPDGHVEKNCGCSVGQCLCARPRGLRSGDKAHDAGQSCRFPTAVVRTRRLPPLTTVPAMTVARDPSNTVFDSPIIIDSSTSAVPSVTTPSTGTRVPQPKLVAKHRHGVSGAAVVTSMGVRHLVTCLRVGHVRLVLSPRPEARAGDIRRLCFAVLFLFLAVLAARGFTTSLFQGLAASPTTSRASPMVVPYVIGTGYAKGRNHECSRTAQLLYSGTGASPPPPCDPSWHLHPHVCGAGNYNYPRTCHQSFRVFKREPH